ncbi:uncharacterized protein NPIL_617231, partial [Nephila pilipes]
KFVLWLLFIALLLALGSDAGLIKHRNRDNNDGVETLLAVGLIAKALSDIEKEPEPNQCPPPITKIVHVPVYKEKIYVVKEKDIDHSKYSTIVFLQINKIIKCAKV